jgi:hypothetical protein
MALAAGAARIEITPRSPCTLAGYGARDHASEGVHDPLYLRALVVCGTDEQEAALLSADILWFGRGTAGTVRDRIEGELGIPRSRVFLAGTHTHSAPATADGDTNGEWIAGLADRALAAAALARTRLRPARLRVHAGRSRIGINRRERRENGAVVLGHNPEGPIDRDLYILAADDDAGAPLARLVHFGCHGVVMGEGNYRISADWPGTAARSLETRLGCPVLFCNGGAGDVNSRIGPQDDFAPMEALAEEFTGDCLAALEREGAPANTGGDTVSGLELPVQLPHKQRCVEEGRGRHAEIPLHGLRVGDVRLAGYPGEMFSQTAMAVREASGSPPALVCSYVDEGDRGYVPVREAYDAGGYEVAVSPYSEEAEQVLRQGLIDLLGQV